MAYVAPNTDVKLLSGVPLNNDYQNTVYFTDRATQASAFTPYVKYTLSSYNYQRSSRNTIRVGKAVEDLYDCNYMMFRNTSFGSKWFYAFITEVEYINNNTSQITFEIDVMQTWLSGENLDYKLLPSFIDRNHTETDIVGENVTYENVDIGNAYIPTNYEYLSVGGTQYASVHFIFYTTFTYDRSSHSFADYVPSVKERTLTGLNTIIYSYDSSEMQTFLTDVVENNKLSGIISVFAVPPEFDLVTSPKLVSFRKHNRAEDSLNGYVPRNKKLYTHPYNMMHIVSSKGCADYMYEQFLQETCTFYQIDALLPSPSTSLIPYEYGSANYRSDARVSEVSYPQCTFNSDVFKEYLASHLAEIPLGVTMDVGASILGFALGHPVGGIVPVIDIANKIGKMADLSTLPPQLNGTQSCTADWLAECVTLIICQYTIRAEYAEIIDNFFDKFGYSINKIDVPKLCNRPVWTYIKTLGLNIRSNLNESDVKKITTIFDNGITFWRHISDVGDYSLDNQPYSESYEARLVAPVVATNAFYRHFTVNEGLNRCLLIDAQSGAVMPNCVGYTWGRWYELLKSVPTLSRGDAGGWYRYSDGYGRKQPSGTPQLGDIACFSSPTSVGGGHVNVIEQKNSDTEFVTSNSYYGDDFFILEYLRWDEDAQTWKRYNYNSGREITGYTLQGFIVNPVNA